jgi:hypothetical protein
MATATLYANQETATSEDTIDFETFAHICGIKYIVPKTGVREANLKNQMNPIKIMSPEELFEWEARK